MIETTNLTNTAYDRERYRDADDVRAFLRTFSLDGLEVMPWGENTLSFLPPDAVPGLPLGYFPCWVDFYRFLSLRAHGRGGHRRFRRGAEPGDGGTFVFL